VTLSAGMLEAIARDVHQAGGDSADAVDLAGAWRRLKRVSGPRADAMRRQAMAARCCCRDGGEAPTADGRCRRCCGRTDG
jgi:hypothetical protein